jgi:hypothetical protein
MLGRPLAWLRWLLALAAAIGAARVGMLLLAPAMPAHFAWGGAVLLGLSVVFLLLPLPHEHLLAARGDDRPRGGDRPLGDDRPRADDARAPTAS